MKGTARRGADHMEDKHIAHWLQNDIKNRSENVMIVDLLATIWAASASTEACR